MDRFKEAVNLAVSGRLEEAKNAFEEILLDEPRNAEVLYNLGMCFTELGQPDKAITALRKSIEYNPKHSNSYVALGYAYDRMGDSETASKYLLEALKLDPDNAYAMRNLGGLFGKSGDMEQSLFYLDKAYKINASDANTVYGLAYCYQQLKDYQKADQYYRKVLEMDAPSNLKELAKDGLREIAIIHLKSKGLRMDAVMYMVSALKLFKIETKDRVKEISFEIALKGRGGLDINNPDKKYTINSLPGTFTGLQLVSYMYVGFKKIALEQDIGVDLSQEYAMATQLFKDDELI
jgi:tetratricopeptide (TPR) repeat protein